MQLLELYHNYIKVKKHGLSADWAAAALEARRGATDGRPRCQEATGQYKSNAEE